MKRKITQIAVLPEGEHTRPTVYALGDDGTMWFCNITAEWTQMDPLPDREPTEAELRAKNPLVSVSQALGSPPGARRHPLYDDPM